MLHPLLEATILRKLGECSVQILLFLDCFQSTMGGPSHVELVATECCLHSKFVMQ